MTWTSQRMTIAQMVSCAELHSGGEITCYQKGHGNSTLYYRAPDDRDCLQYQNTTILYWCEETRTLTLDNGGFETATTKRKMNKYLEDWGLKVYVWQHKFQWWVSASDGWEVSYDNGQTWTQNSEFVTSDQSGFRFENFMRLRAVHVEATL